LAALAHAAPSGAQSERLLTRLDEVAPTLTACWRPPTGLRMLEAVEVTARFSIRRDGSLIGTPRVTFASGEVALQARELLTQSAVEAIRACTPLRISPGLGQAIAGRPFAIRFIYKGPQGRGA
jgi:hypothetical protein